MTTRSVFLTTGQAAQQLGISRRTLGRAVDRGEIPCARQTPGGWSLFLTTDVATLAQRLSAPLTAAHPRAVARIHDRPTAAAPTALLCPEREGQRAVRAGGDAAHAGVIALPAALLTALYTHLPSGLIVVDTAGQVVFMNKAATRLNADVVLATKQGARGGLAEPPIASALLPHRTRIVHVLAGQTVPDADYVLGREGERRYRVIQVATMALRDRSDQMTGAMLILTDQTERVGGQAMLARVADALAQEAREALARTAVTLAEEAVTQARDNQDLTRSNTALELQAELARGADMLAQEAREALARTAVTLAEEAETQAQDNQDLTRSNLALELQAELAQDTREALARTAVTLAEEAALQAQDNRDLTRANTALELQAELTRVTNALALGKERFRLLVTSVRDVALYMLDPQGHVLSWNEGAQRLTGYTAAETKGQHISLFYTPQDREQGVPAEGLRRAAEQGHYEAEGWRLRKDGSRFWAEVHITAVQDAQGQLIGFGKVTRDLTEARRVDEAIRGLNASLEQRVVERTAALATANGQLRAINQELEAFAYSVSHDLRTPLRAISGFGEILLTSYSAVLDARGRHYLERIHTATAQMGRLIDDLLALSRLSRAEMRTASVDLTDLARAVAAALQQSEPERAVTWDIAPGLTAPGDAALLRVALDNLLGNAWKFTSGHPQARITVGARQEEGETVYFVRDDGAGFDMAYADKLFGAFQRLHTTREFAGTGIGLATVQRIVHRHGGRVWAQGAVEGGATISFTLAAPGGDPHAA